MKCKKVTRYNNLLCTKSAAFPLLVFHSFFNEYDSHERMAHVQLLEAVSGTPKTFQNLSVSSPAAEATVQPSGLCRKHTDKNRISFRTKDFKKKTQNHKIEINISLFSSPGPYIELS